MRYSLAAIVVLLAITVSARAADDLLIACEARAAGLIGPAHKAFVSACLTGEIPAYPPRPPKN